MRVCLVFFVFVSFCSSAGLTREFGEKPINCNRYISRKILHQEDDWLDRPVQTWSNQSASQSARQPTWSGIAQQSEAVKFLSGPSHQGRQGREVRHACLHQGKVAWRGAESNIPCACKLHTLHYSYMYMYMYVYI